MSHPSFKYLPYVAVLVLMEYMGILAFVYKRILKPRMARVEELPSSGLYASDSSLASKLSEVLFYCDFDRTYASFSYHKIASGHFSRAKKAAASSPYPEPDNKLRKLIELWPEVLLLVYRLLCCAFFGTITTWIFDLEQAQNYRFFTFWNTIMLSKHIIITITLIHSSLLIYF